MAEKKKHHKKTYHKPRPPWFEYQVGDLVYFHAFAEQSDDKSYYLCKGYITRQPTSESKVYKVAITSIDPKSVLCGDNPHQAKQLLGRTIAKPTTGLTIKPTGLFSKLYEDNEWLDVDNKTMQKIETKLKRYKQ